ncbi:SRPBCC family protein [Blastopirellula sp. JC732]|uniref:SRPBCC family protein n=1 Tax=Blastopirellula sediminis TaxID=2894196 RepID=A0A9X1SGU5_9BACT|nr:SRPBCC family protein [Blastopirellula sediminis]MCC9607355.1 SRPBCC family protein [Blastopirellula sediminis]MCC9629352.1 SRPBCC family protein [Blastopirellula sediminis]
MNDSAPAGEALSEGNAPPAAPSTAVGRWLRTISAVAVLAIVMICVLYFIGSRPIHYSAEVKILAPPEKIFPYLTEPDLLVKWMTDVVEVRPISGEDHQVGATAAVVVEANGDRFEMESELLKEVPNQELEVQLTSDMFVIVSDYQLKPNGRETTVSLDMVANYKGIACVMAPLMGSSIQEKLEADFNLLREEVQSGSISE